MPGRTGRNQTRRGRRGNLLTSKPTPRRESRLKPTGATPSSKRPIQPPPPEAQLPLDAQHEGAGENINTLEGYFTNLAAAATNEKELLYQLVLNNTTLTNTNESLVALVKKQANDLKNLEQELARLRKPQSQASARNPPHPLCQLQKGGVPSTSRLLRAREEQRQAPPRMAQCFVTVGDGKQ